MNFTGIFSSRAMATTMPPLAVPILELGDYQAGDAERLVEFAGLIQGVGTGGGIEDEQNLMRCGGRLLLQ